MSGVLVLGVDTGPAKHGYAMVCLWADGRAAFEHAGTVTVAEAIDSLAPLQSTLGIVHNLTAIECPQHAYSAATASLIIATARAAGELGGAAKARGYRVEYVTAADWRAGLLGAANAHDKAIAAWVAERIQGWPKKSNPHTRDAAALAVWAGRRWLRAQEAGQ